MAEDPLKEIEEALRKSDPELAKMFQGHANMKPAKKAKPAPRAPRRPAGKSWYASMLERAEERWEMRRQRGL